MNCKYYEMHCIEHIIVIVADWERASNDMVKRTCLVTRSVTHLYRRISQWTVRKTTTIIPDPMKMIEGEFYVTSQ